VQSLPKHTNIVHAIRHCERVAKAKDPLRPALVPGAVARVTSNGRITVELATADGGAVVWTATPVVTYRYEPATPPRRPTWLKRPASAPSSPSAQLKAAIDMTLNALVRVERATQLKPEITDIAAE
jgi:hypothetical protein